MIPFYHRSPLHEIEEPQSDNEKDEEKEKDGEPVHGQRLYPSLPTMLSSG